MSNGGLPPKAPPLVAQTKTSRLLSRRHQSSNGNLNFHSSTPRQNAGTTVANETGSLTFGNSSQLPPSRRYSNFSNVNQNRVISGLRSGTNNRSLSLANDVTTPRNSRLSLPSIGGGGGGGTFSRQARVDTRRRTNPAHDYFNELGMVLDSDESPELTDREPRVTPRNSSSIGQNADVTNPVAASSSYNFPMSRNSLLSSRSNGRRNTLTDSGRNFTEQVDTAARENNVSRNEVSMPGGSSEFTQVMSELYGASDSTNSSVTSNTGNNNANFSNNGNNTSNSITPRASQQVTSVALNQPRQPMINLAGVQNSPQTPRSRVSPSENAYDVESVDEVLSRIRRQNNLPVEPAPASSPSQQPHTLNVNSSNSSSHSANSTTSVYSPSVASRTSATSSNSGSTNTARVIRSTANVGDQSSPTVTSSTATPRTANSLANGLPSNANETQPRSSLNNSQRSSLTSRALYATSSLNISPNAGSETQGSTLDRPSETTNQNATWVRNQTDASSGRANVPPTSVNSTSSSETPAVATSVPRRYVATASTESTLSSRESEIRPNATRFSNPPSMQQRRQFSETPAVTSSRVRQNSDLDLTEDEIRAILATPPNERSGSNQIFDDPENSDPQPVLPPVRNPVSTSTVPVSSTTATTSVRPIAATAASNQPNRNIIGVRFTTTFNDFASGTSGSRPLRASSDTNNIFSSDESDDDDDESVTAGTSSANQAAQDRIPHLDSHIGILHLLGLDLPQSTTDVILMNQRSILEQLLETYITLMASLQSAETEQRPAGLSSEAITSLPLETITKQQVAENATCSICLANFELEESSLKLPECSHFFHQLCISNWLEKSPTCPMCRTPVHSSN